MKITNTSKGKLTFLPGFTLSPEATRTATPEEIAAFNAPVTLGWQSEKMITCDPEYEAPEGGKPPVAPVEDMTSANDTEEMRIIRTLAAEDYTASGVPKTDAISALTDPERVVTAAERDAAWEALEAVGFKMPAKKLPGT